MRFEFLVLKELTVTIAQTLFLKNIPFCLYRFPAENAFRMAIEESFLPHQKDQVFLISPFHEDSLEKELQLAVVNNDFLTNDFLQHIEKVVVGKDFPEIQLPPETTKKEYFQKLKAYLQEIHSGKIEKAILSRVIYEDKPKDFNLFDCFLRLSASYPETLSYLLVTPQSGIWMGATPELLLEKRQNLYAVMALAGTQPRNESGKYFWREKETVEHLMVGRHIQSVFKNNGFILIKKSPLTTKETGKVAHLKTDYLFEDIHKMKLELLLKDLHPTPAIGGLPVNNALACILEHEGYDRRYYSGIIGQTDFSSTADLYINLRCMQVGKDKIAIYTGGGITAASDAEEEWQETILKSKTVAEKINPSKTMKLNETIR